MLIYKRDDKYDKKTHMSYGKANKSVMVGFVINLLSQRFKTNRFFKFRTRTRISVISFKRTIGVIIKGYKGWILNRSNYNEYIICFYDDTLDIDSLCKTKVQFKRMILKLGSYYQWTYKHNRRYK